jgi:hypothetical protein
VRYFFFGLAALATAALFQQIMTGKAGSIYRDTKPAEFRFAAMCGVLIIIVLAWGGVWFGGKS